LPPLADANVSLIYQDQDGAALCGRSRVGREKRVIGRDGGRRRALDANRHWRVVDQLDVFGRDDGSGVAVNFDLEFGRLQIDDLAALAIDDRGVDGQQVDTGTEHRGFLLRPLGSARGALSSRLRRRRCGSLRRQCGDAKERKG
jgi:hypothetical protein